VCDQYWIYNYDLQSYSALSSVFELVGANAHLSHSLALINVRDPISLTFCNVGFSSRTFRPTGSKGPQFSKTRKRHLKWTIERTQPRAIEVANRWRNYKAISRGLGRFGKRTTQVRVSMVADTGRPENTLWSTNERLNMMGCLVRRGMSHITILRYAQLIPRRCSYTLVKG